jgi:succinate dehydrogenase / fumarate reductase flavoprotein subunit
MKSNSKIPQGLLEDKWDNYKNSLKPVNPANKRKFKIIVVGSGLAGASASATWGNWVIMFLAFVFRIVLGELIV